VTPREHASWALEALVTDDPLWMRVNEALKCLKPLRSMKGFDTTIIEMINNVCDQNYSPKERGKAVAEVIRTIFYLCE
jgi:hypothetical protein